MKHLLHKLSSLKLLILLAALLGMGSNTAWGQAAVSTVLWAEDFSGFTSSPAGSFTDSHTGTTVYGGVTVTYAVTSSGSTTQVYTSGGPNGSNNLLISKNKGTFSISGISTGQATELTVSYAKSGSGTIAISSSTTGVTISGSASGSTITTNGASTIQLTFKNTNGSNNLRIDDISVTVKTAGGGGGSTTYTVTYDDNGATSGNVPEDDNEYEADDEVTVLDNTGSLVKTGYAFGGWNTRADGNGTNYDADDTFTIAANTTLYAKWTPYTVTAQSNNNSYGTVSVSGFVITANPTEGYTYAATAYTVSSGTATVVQNGNEFTVTPSSNCTVTINFEAIPTHTATFSVNGNTSRTATVYDGGSITFPEAAADPSASQIPATYNGKTFMGWYTTEYSHATVAPSFVNTATATMSTSDVTYYAVYATVDAGDPTVISLSNSTISSNSSKNSYSDDYNINNWTGRYLINNTSSVYSLQLGYNSDSSKSAYNSHLTTPNCVDNIQSITIETQNNTANGRKFFLCSADNLGTASISDATYGSGSLSEANGSVTINVTGNTKQLHIYPDGTAYIKTISLTSQSVSISDYTTDARSEAGISFANASVDAQLTSDYTGQILTNANSVSPITYSSSDVTVATINSSTGAITEKKKAGSTTITASFAGNATYKPAVASYTLNVTEKTPAGLTYAVTEVAKSYGDENFTNALSNPNNLDGVTYVSSNTGVATVDEDGEVTIKTVGSTTITASFAGNATYAVGNASYTLTVSKATPTLNFAAANITGHIGEAVSANALTNPANLTVSYSSSDGTVANVNSSTGVVANPLKAGTTTITASFDGNDTYVAGSTSYTLKVLANPTITVSDQTIAWGETFTVDDSGFIGGDVTVSSGNTAIATIDELVITPVACGTVTITVSTAENEDYRDGSATFNLTINAPTGSTTADELIATFDFTDNTDWELPTSETSTTTSYDNGVYEITLAGAHYFQSTNKYLMLKGNTGVLTFPEFDKSVTKIEVVGKSGASSATKENIYVESTAVSTETTGSTGTNTFAINSNYQDVGTIYSLKVTDKNAQITRINVYTSPASPTVTLNANGFLAYASQNPMDFSSVTGFTAWQATDVSGSTITFEKITGKIKGGQGVLLKGTANAEVTIPLADSENVLEDNLLKATLAPTYFADETIYGLKGDAFYLNNPCTLKANRAYFNAEDVTSGGSLSKSFTFIFEDPTTGITEPRQATREEVESIFNLGGQRLQKLQRGINIVNGKKVLVK